MIYLLKSNEWYKIGYAKNLIKRVTQYGTYNPNVCFIAYREGDEKLESELHKIFYECKHPYRKEWFLASHDKIEELIKEYSFIDASELDKQIFQTTYREKKRNSCANLSEETREKLSKAGRKGIQITLKNKTPESYKKDVGVVMKRSRSISQYSLQWEYITTYTTASNAARALGKYHMGSHILDCCRGKRRTSGGFKWKFTDDNQI